MKIFLAKENTKHFGNPESMRRKLTKNDAYEGGCFFSWYLCGKLGVVILHRIVDLIPAGDNEGGLCTPDWGPISILPFGYTPFIGWAIK